MADEVKAKRPVPPQFQKKKKEKENEQELIHTGQGAPAPATMIALTPQDAVVATLPDIKNVQKEIDKKGLVKDLMHNKYFRITEKEARPIVEKMISEGADALCNVRWFLAVSERKELAEQLKEKYGLM